MSSQLIGSQKTLLLLRKQVLSHLCKEYPLQSSQLNPRLLSKLYPLVLSRQYHGRSKIGKREVVGFGMNGAYSYFDAPDIPMPAIRFREEDTDIARLREKERANWKDLTVDEKKKLYRFSFCRTYAEMQAPTGEWKSITAGVLAIIASALWLYVLLKKFVYGPMPESTSLEWRKKQRDWYILWKVNPIEGISSKYDYENNRWKD